MIRRIRIPAANVALSDERPSRGERTGPPLVLLHGFTGSKASWAAVRAAFASTRRVLAIDLPGHGDTVVTGRAFDFSLTATAGLVAETLVGLRVPRADVVGYSMGGRVALQLAIDHGDRVAHLVLESASAGLATAAARARRRAADERLAESIERDGIARFVARWEALPLFRSLASMPPLAHEAFRRQRLACRPAGLAASLRGMGTGVQPWLGERAESVTVPVLLVTGALDRKFTRKAVDLLPRFARGCHEIIETAGHVPHIEQPQHFIAAVRTFLADGAGRRAASTRGE
ncbi:MAG: 2-succinyl-6-hydroxy-2,4-cyclohexadiene-1-carboxylate synthase [Candidatus Binatia bacterium]